MKEIPVSEALHVVEGFTRVFDDELLWEVMVGGREVYDWGVVGLDAADARRGRRGV